MEPTSWVEQVLAWPYWATTIGLVGGLAGMLSAVWALVVAPRPAWSLNRIVARRLSGDDLHSLEFIFVNRGEGVARDAHITRRAKSDTTELEFPPTGRLQVALGETLSVSLTASRVPDVNAGRRLVEGDDDLFDIDCMATIKWRQSGWPFQRRKRFDLNKLQPEVPLIFDFGPQIF